MRFLAVLTSAFFGFTLLAVTGVYSLVRQHPSDSLPHLAFISEDGFLYRMNADGENLQQLAATGYASFAPTWSQDGKWVGYIQNQREVRGQQITLRGRMQAPLTTPIRLYGAMAWHERGVAFHNGFRLYLDDGNQVKELPAPQGQKSHLAWSPDGAWLAFVVLDRPTGYNIYLIRPDGTHLTPLTNDARQNIYPLWSPDSKWIAFVSNNSTFGFQLHKIRPDGRNRQQITDAISVAHFSPPAWSPDGAWLAFAGQRGSMDWNIYRVRSDGSLQEPLTDSRYPARNPAWSADGRFIAFQSQQHGSSMIYRMKADGSHLQPLTPDTLSAKYPVWSPRREFDWQPFKLLIVGLLLSLLFGFFPRN